MKNNKNKRKYSDLEDLIDNNDASNVDDSDDSDYDDNANNNKKIKKKHIDKYNLIKKITKEKNISMDDVLDLNLPITENIWFYENIKIRDNYDLYTEEHNTIKNTIYQKYLDMKKTDFKKLDKIKNKFDGDDDNNIVTKIINSKHSDDVKKIMYKKYRRYIDNNIKENSDEKIKILEWIDTVLELPTTKSTATNSKSNIINNLSVSDQLSILWKKLNDSMFGLDNVKEKIMEAVCSKLADSNNESRYGKIITLVGPPGVGKTAISSSIAESLNMPFDQISLGSIKDSVMLTGHSSTYVGSMPSLFTKILLKSKSLNTVILLDEIDKIPETAEGKSISSVLLHVLDKTQNNRFKDMYMPEINLDLSKIMFICAANSVDEIDPILKDRMTIIEILGYDINQKTNIALKYLFPKIRQELGFDKTDLNIEKNVMEYLIVNKTQDQEGMRSVEKNIYKLCERILLLKYSTNINLSYHIKNIRFPYQITIDTINELC